MLFVGKIENEHYLPLSRLIKLLIRDSGIFEKKLGKKVGKKSWEKKGGKYYLITREKINFRY